MLWYVNYSIKTFLIMKNRVLPDSPASGCQQLEEQPGLEDARHQGCLREVWGATPRAPPSRHTGECGCWSTAELQDASVWLWARPQLSHL